jgi:hypothetical protein
VTANFIPSQIIMLKVLVNGEIELRRLVAARAIKAPGTTTTAAPNSADCITTTLPDTSQIAAATPAPTPTWLSTTHHGDSVG